jgi:hypothetical protein
MASVTRLVTSVVAEVCDMDATSLINMEGLSHRTFQLVEFLGRAVGSSPDPEALASLDRWGGASLHACCVTVSPCLWLVLLQ